MAINKEKAVGEKSSVLGKAITYIVLGLLAITIIIPVAWVFMASVKENSEFYGNPFALPKGIHWQNFVDAWTKANMGDYFMTSVMITAMALIILLIVALPAAYVLSRYTFRGSKLLNGGFMAGLFINVNYIVVPIFLMFVSGDRLLNKLFGKGFFLNNPGILTGLYPAFWPLYNALPEPGLRRVQQATQPVRERRRIITKSVAQLTPRPEDED